jgi:allantoin racemase
MLAEQPVKIYYQLLSSETRGREFIAAVQEQCNAAAAPATTVEVRGTSRGALADDYRVFQHYDAREVIANALRIRAEGGYDAFVFGNSLDVAVTDLRELLDIPVVTLMEVCCHVACTMGDKFAVIVPNRKFAPRYAEIVRGYRLEQRSAGVYPLNYKYVSDQHRAFTDAEVADRALAELERVAATAVGNGAEVLVVPGPSSTLMRQRGLREIAGAPAIDSYPLLVKWAEMMVAMKRLTGSHVSRLGLYSQPPKEVLEQAAEIYGIPELAPG